MLLTFRKKEQQENTQYSNATASAINRKPQKAIWLNSKQEIYQT